MSEDEIAIRELLKEYEEKDTGDRRNELEVSKTKLLTECFIRSINSMNNNANSSQSLAKKVFWLNVILVFATVTMAVISVINVFGAD